MEAADLIAVPSGRDVWFHEFQIGNNGDGLTYHFRFVAPDIGQVENQDLEETEKDMSHLCQEFALSRVSVIGPKPSRIVISMADRETEFGVANRQARQVFESYSLDGDTCIWEPF